MGITRATPAKTGKPDAPRHFRQHPQRSKKNSTPRLIDRGYSHKTCRNAGIVERQHTGEQQNRQNRQGRGQTAIRVHGNKQPPEGARQPCQRKSPAQQPALTRRGAAAQQPGQQAQGQQLQPALRLTAPRWRDRDRVRQPGDGGQEQWKRHEKSGHVR